MRVTFREPQPIEIEIIAPDGVLVEDSTILADLHDELKKRGVTVRITQRGSVEGTQGFEELIKAVTITPTFDLVRTVSEVLVVLMHAGHIGKEAWKAFEESRAAHANGPLKVTIPLKNTFTPDPKD